MTGKLDLAVSEGMLRVCHKFSKAGSTSKARNTFLLLPQRFATSACSHLFGGTEHITDQRQGQFEIN